MNSERYSHEPKPMIVGRACGKDTDVEPLDRHNNGLRIEISLDVNRKHGDVTRISPSTEDKASRRP